MQNYELVKKNDLQNKTNIQVALRLNVNKIHNYNCNNVKKTKILKQMIEKEQTKIQQDSKQGKYMFNDEKQFIQNNIIEILPCYKNFLVDHYFLEMLDILIKKLQIANNNESKIKENKFAFIEIPNENEKIKYQSATSWLKNMSPNQSEFLDFYLQIYEVYKGLEQILGLEHKQKDQMRNYKNIILLHQNKNKYCERLLHVGSFVQNLLQQNFRQQQLNCFRTLYINFTGENQQQQIDFWSLCHHDNKEISKFISFYPLNYDSQKQYIISQNQEQENKEYYSKSEIPLKKNTNQQKIYPILYDSILILQQIQIIYSTLILPMITSFKPKFIYLDLQISNNFQIELEGIEYLLRQLQKKANLIVYPCFKFDTQKMDEQNQQQYMQNHKLYDSYLNAVVSGISGFKMIKTKIFNDETPFMIFRWSNIMQTYYYQQNIFLQKQIQFLNSQNQQYNNLIQYQQIYQFAIRIQDDIILWVIPLDCYLSNIKFINYYCFYDQNIILLFNQMNQSIYSQEISNLPQNIYFTQIKQKFNTLQVPKNLIEPSILILDNYLIMIYGHEQSENEPEFFDGILLFDLIQLEEFQQYNRVYDDRSKELLAFIKNRRCPQICQNNGYKSDNKCLSFFLIGGEFMKSDHIQNFIEVVYVNLKNQTFHSYPIKFEMIYSQATLKPWPYQLVLEYNYENINLYLIQAGNYQLKLNKFQFPIDPNYHNFSQLLVQKHNTFELYDIRVKRQDQYYFKIEQLYNNSRNWILKRNLCSNSQIVWKAYITRIVKLKNPLNSKILRPFQQQFENIDFDTSFFICIELTNQLLIPNNHLDFKNYTVELNYRIMSLQKINK